MNHIGIFVGTVYGNALLIAEKIKPLIAFDGHQVKLFEYGTFDDWSKYKNEVVLVITSTTGNGNTPANIEPLLQQIKDRIVEQISLRYGIIALGDSRYDNFCSAGRSIDLLLQNHGATRIGNILEIDAAIHLEPWLLVYPWIKDWINLI